MLTRLYRLALVSTPVIIIVIAVILASTTVVLSSMTSDEKQPSCKDVQGVFLSSNDECELQVMMKMSRSDCEKAGEQV